jgi:hypothetical protein
MVGWKWEVEVEVEFCWCEMLLRSLRFVSRDRMTKPAITKGATFDTKCVSCKRDILGVAYTEIVKGILDILFSVQLVIHLRTDHSIARNTATMTQSGLGRDKFK